MIQIIKEKALAHGIQLAVLPLNSILDVKSDMEDLINKNSLIDG